MLKQKTECQVGFKKQFTNSKNRITEKNRGHRLRHVKYVHGSEVGFLLLLFIGPQKRAVQKYHHESEQCGHNYHRDGRFRAIAENVKYFN